MSSSSSSSECRHRTQLGSVLATGLLTIGACVFARRSVVSKRYVPKTFDANHIVPSFNFMQDAVQAVMNATLLSTGLFAFGTASTVYLMDVESLQDFGHKMKQKFGADANEAELAQKVEVNPDKDTVEVAKTLQSWFSSKK